MTRERGADERKNSFAVQYITYYVFQRNETFDRFHIIYNNNIIIIISSTVNGFAEKGKYRCRPSMNGRKETYYFVIFFQQAGRQMTDL